MILPDLTPLYVRMADYRCRCGGGLQLTVLGEDTVTLTCVCMACGERPVAFTVPAGAFFGKPADWLGREMGMNLRAAAKARRLVLAPIEVTTA